MSNYTKLYWLTRLDSIEGLLIFFIVMASVVLMAYCAFSFPFLIEGDEEEENLIKKRFGKYKNISIVILIAASILITFIPTKNDVIFIVAGGKTIDFIQQDTSVNKIPGQATALISEFFDKQIEELKKDKE